MIEQTFLHLPGIGEKTEQRLWQAGFVTWEKLWCSLASGVPARGLFASERQLGLFQEPDETVNDSKSIAWLDCLDESRRALRTSNFGFFTGLLKPADHWRLFDAVLGKALFLDIETTGLSFDHHYITVIGALFEGRFHQWVWPENLAELADIIGSASIVITFNGRRFDLPFLHRQVPILPIPKAHIDLLYVARAAGMKGGQKAIEQQLDLDRNEEISGLDGEAAVAAWCSSLYGNSRSFQQLLKYNRADVEMMPEIAAHLYQRLNKQQDSCVQANAVKIARRKRLGHKPPTHSVVQAEWQSRRPSIERLQCRYVKRFNTEPRVVGIDLRSKTENPTGWALSEGSEIQTRIVYADDDILDLTLSAQPDLVSIDAPLFLPRGRQCVEDDSPCRKRGGIVRDAERLLWSRGIRVYPALIKQMQGLTRRGIELAKRLEEHGIKVIESYPGAAQDILNIPRKKFDQDLLAKGLSDFGYVLRGNESHDELDAVTSALVGHFYLADQYEAIGADDEGYMIIPKFSGMEWTAKPRTQVVSLLGLPGAGKTTLGRALAERLGWNRFVLGDALRSQAESDGSLRCTLSRGEMAPERLVKRLIQEAVAENDRPGLIIDGFPRHAAQLQSAAELFSDWRMLYLDVPENLAIRRITKRIVCSHCGYVSESADVGNCPSCKDSDWQTRLEDVHSESVQKRISSSNQQIGQVLVYRDKLPLIQIDATGSADDTADAAIRLLLRTQLGNGKRVTQG